MENQTQQPNQQPSQNQIPMDEQKREKNKRIAIALVALAAVILLAVGGMLLLQQAGLRPSSPTPVEQTPPSAPSPQPETEVLDTSDWQTYRSRKFGFEVKYPPYLVVYKDSNGRFHALSKKGEAEIDSFLVIMTVDELSLENYLEDFEKSASSRTVRGGFDTFTILQKRNIKVGPYPAVQYEIVQSGSPSDVIDTFLDLTPRVILLLSTGKDRLVTEPSVTESLRKLHNQILSTFRFVDSIDTPDWQTYRNDEFGYSIQIPPEFWQKRSELYNGAWQIFFDEERTVAIEVGIGKASEDKGGYDEIVESAVQFENLIVGEKERFGLEEVVLEKIKDVSFDYCKGAQVKYWDEPNIILYQTFCRGEDSIVLIQFKMIIEEKNNLESYLEKYDQILSTFRFVE